MSAVNSFRMNNLYEYSLPHTGKTLNTIIELKWYFSMPHKNVVEEYKVKFSSIQLFGGYFSLQLASGKN